MTQKNIKMGVCGWGDHHDLYTQGVRTSDKLSVYASHFPIVEVDSSFYAILPQKNYEKWAQDTPDSFGFVVKPYQAMTGHQRVEEKETLTDLFARFEDSIQPLVEANKLKALLFQFPPWFDCTREHVQYVKHCITSFQDYPVAVEFRNKTWFEGPLKEKTLSFLTEHHSAHVVCDEPQVGSGCVPIVVSVTKPELALVRFHGRNVAGWRDPGQAQNWRDVRYLYNYSDSELLEWKPRIEQLAKDAKEVCILFNNNSGGDAVRNTKRFMQMIGVEPDDLNPRQLELF
jgi:uncharacterized protein YecE (DUF72 family)